MRILFTSSLTTSFIREDLSLLGRHFEVDHLLTRGLSALWRIPLRVFRSDVTFTWFASVYAFWVVLWARIAGKPSIVVIGGVDASREPAIRYGIWLSPWKAPLVRWTMRNAGTLLPVDPFFEGEIRRLATYDGANITVLPTGYDGSRWTPDGERERMVLCVASCHNPDRMRKKGIDLLARAAALLPDVPVVVVGIPPEVLERSGLHLPPGMRILPPVAQDGLLAHYRRAKVYCQPSYTEGLPNSLCEAMLCGCAPVGTATGGIPSALREVGWMVPYGDPGALAAALRTALEADTQVHARARAHILREFPLHRREEGLVAAVRASMQGRT